MARVTEISVIFGMTVSMGAKTFESIRIDVGATSILSEGDDPATEHKTLLEDCKRQAMIAAAPLVKRRKEVEDSVWNALPDYVKAQLG
jgi:hypothetical protein